MDTDELCEIIRTTPFLTSSTGNFEIELNAPRNLNAPT